MFQHFAPSRGVLLLFFWTLCVSLGAQETAEQFFNRVSEHYAAVLDYSATLSITRGESTMAAEVFYKTPDRLRLDFSEPEDMVLVTNGNLFQIWVPSRRVTFVQSIDQSRQVSGIALSTGRGLELMGWPHFSIAYLSSPEPQPLEKGSRERVTKLKLESRSAGEGYRELILSIDADLHIRRVVGLTTLHETIVFDFTNLRFHQGIPDSRFEYESPPEGNIIENFLYDPDD